MTGVTYMDSLDKGKGGGGSFVEVKKKKGKKKRGRKQQQQKLQQQLPHMLMPFARECMLQVVVTLCVLFFFVVMRVCVRDLSTHTCMWIGVLF